MSNIFRKIVATICFFVLVVIFGAISFIGLYGGTWGTSWYLFDKIKFFGGLLGIIVSFIVYIKCLKNNNKILYFLILTIPLVIYLILGIFYSLLK